MKDKEGAVIRIVLQAALALSCIAAPAVSQTRDLTPEELTKRAEVVAVGKVSGLVSQWSTDHSRIYTTVTLSVSQYLKGGSAAGPLNILVAGGEVDGVGEIYSHTAAFRRDEDVLVFAEKDRQGNFRVTHGQQGKFDIRRDEATGKAFVGNRPMEDVASAVQKAIGLSKQRQ